MMEEASGWESNMMTIDDVMTLTISHSQSQ